MILSYKHILRNSHYSDNSEPAQHASSSAGIQSASRVKLRNSDCSSVIRAVLWHFCEINIEYVLRDAHTKIHSFRNQKGPKCISKTQSRRVKQRKKEALTNVASLHEQNSVNQ
jgi:hypothetical protein